MVIIVEGLDGVGKTTLCQLLSKKIGFEYIHESYTDDNNIKFQRVIDLMNRLHNNQNCIYDRTTLIDDFVYQFLNKSPSELVNYESIILDLLNRCKIFNLNIDENIRFNRLKQRGDQFITNDMIQQISANYDSFYNKLNSVQEITITEDNEKNINELIRRINND